MPHEPNPHTHPSQDIGNAALKTFIAVSIKARKDEHAWKPDGGWAAYAGLPERSFRHSLTSLCAAGLLSREGEALAIDRTGWSWEEGRGRRDEAPRYVRVPHYVLRLPADLVRAWIACLSLADWTTGASTGTCQRL